MLEVIVAGIIVALLGIIVGLIIIVAGIIRGFLGISGIVVGFLLNTALLWLVSHFFHWISFDSTLSLLITSFIYTIILLFLGIVFGFNLIVRIPLEILGLWVMSKVVSGFHIAGFWQLITTYIFMSVVAAILTVIIRGGE
jgi:uncharacterized membrane protein YvlD (DUF360 family)